jgi:hypothetical protein
VSHAWDYSLISLPLYSINNSLKDMAFRKSFRSARRSFSGAGAKVKKQLSSARRTAGKHRKKAATLTTVLLVVGGYFAYDKLLKK